MRWHWIFSGRVPFNSDEAVVGLMARHILQGERPGFFYGQAYMGSLDAWLNALGFAVLGESVRTMRLVQTCLWVLLVLMIFSLTRSIFHSPEAGWLATLLFGLPPVNQVLYSTVTLGGYTEALLLGCGCLYLAEKIQADRGSSTPGWAPFFLGLLAGLGLWVFGFSLVFSIPAVTFACRAYYCRYRFKGNFWRGNMLLLLGVILGAAPWWGAALQQGFSPLVRELTGSAVAVEQTSFLQRSASHLVSLLLLGVPAGMGLRPPWSAEWILLPLIPIVLTIWLWITIHAIRLTRENESVKMLLCVLLTLFLAFVFTSFGVDPSGRYFIPVGMVLMMLGGGILAGDQTEKYPWLAPVCLLILVFYQSYGAIEAVRNSPYGLTTQFAPDTSISPEDREKLIAFLREQGFTTGYSDYWTSYPTAFLTEEEIILIPRLPYHHDLTYTTRDDRYPPYTEKVYAADQNVYVTYQNPELDRILSQKLQSAGIIWNEKELGGYRVYSHLSRSVTPEELGLGALLMK